MPPLTSLPQDPTALRLLLQSTTRVLSWLGEQITLCQRRSELIGELLDCRNHSPEGIAELNRRRSEIDRLDETSALQFPRADIQVIGAYIDVTSLATREPAERAEKDRAASKSPGPPDDMGIAYQQVLRLLKADAERCNRLCDEYRREEKPVYQLRLDISDQLDKLKQASSHRGSSGLPGLSEPESRVKVDQETRTVVVDGTEHFVEHVDALAVFAAIAAANGQKVTSKELQKETGYQGRIDKVLNHLPNELRRLVYRKKGSGGGYALLLPKKRP